MTIDELKDYLEERIHDTETRLLLEFRKWAIPANAENRSQRARITAVEQRLDAVEDWMREDKK